ncbi:hypothetical protein [Lacinutrix sp. MEBiC02595]
MDLKENSITNSPFDNSFITSFILPGTIFSICLIIIAFVFKEVFPSWMIINKEPLDSIFANKQRLFKLLQGEYTLGIQVLMLAILIFISIIFGNAISVIGSLSFDHHWYKKTIGYPYERFLSLPSKRYYKNGSNMVIYICVNIASILFILLNSPLTSIYIPIALVLFSIILSLTIKNRETINKLKIYGFLEKYSKKKNKRITEINWVAHKYYKENKLKIDLNFYMMCIIDFFILIKIILSKPFGLTVEFDKSTVKKFKSYYCKKFSTNKFYNSTEIFWNVYIYLYQNEQHLFKSVFNQYKKSIFLRNLTASGSLLIILLFIIKLFLKNTSENFNRWYWWTLSIFLITHLLFVGYNHIYHKSYTKFLFRSFIVSCETSKKTKKQ